MSHSINALTNKYQRHPKVRLQQYLYNTEEPDDNYDFFVSPKFASEILTSIYPMKQRIRHKAQMLRRGQ